MKLQLSLSALVLNNKSSIFAFCTNFYLIIKSSKENSEPYNLE